MKRFIVLVLDGFGVGEMGDVPIVRTDDIGANTALSVLKSNPSLHFPNLEKLGLGNILGDTIYLNNNPNATVGRSELMHWGADTFFGHQEIMGTVPKKQLMEPIKNNIDEIRKKLLANGHLVENIYGTNSDIMLLVDKHAIVCDNVDTDPGQVYNVAAALDSIEFERVLSIAKIMRSVVKVPRIIALGGYGVTVERILQGTLEKPGGYIGISSPLAGVYENNYTCVHIGYGVDPSVQLPYALSTHGIPTYLVGKAADVIANTDIGENYPMVDTDKVMDIITDLLDTKDRGFFCVNVQETDLAGHSENVERYGQILKKADNGIGHILEKLKPDDILCVMADHGNDPLIGHLRHTREMVPIMVYGKKIRPCDFGLRNTMSDVAKTALNYFGYTDGIEGGTSFLSKILI